MKFKNLLAVSLLSLSSVAPFTVAQGSFFLDGDIGRSSADVDAVDDATSINLGVGYDFSQNFGVELSYLDLGSFGTPLGDIDVDGFNLSLFGTVEVAEKVNLFGRLGYYDWDSSFGGDTNSDNDVNYGVGVSYSFTQQVAASIEYNVYGIDDTDIDTFSIGIKYNF